MENKVIITDSTYDVETYLNKGWVVKFVVPQYVATGGSFKEHGKFCFVLERSL